MTVEFHHLVEELVGNEAGNGGPQWRYKRTIMEQALPIH
jgi:hypothetical protein